MPEETEDWVNEMRESWTVHQELMAIDPEYAAQHNAKVAEKRAALAELLRLEDELGLVD